MFFPGDDVDSLVGAGDLATSIEFLLGLIPVPYEAAVYFDGHFTDLGNLPLGTRMSGVAYTTTPVPLPASVLFLVTGLVGIAFRRTQQTYRRSVA